MRSNPIRDVALCIFAGAAICGLLAKSPDDGGVLIGGIFGGVVGLALWMTSAFKRKHLGDCQKGQNP
jgi:hypothetical protein